MSIDETAADMVFLRAALSEGQRELLDRHILNERTDAAEGEWQRARRLIVTAGFGIRPALEELRKLIGRVTFTPRDQEPELLRYLDVARAGLDELEGDDWLKSPRTMEQKRELEKVTR